MMKVRFLLAAVLGVVLVGAGCSGSAPETTPTPTSGAAVEAIDNSAYMAEMAVLETTWDGFAAAAIEQDYDAFQGYVDVELTDLQITSGMGRFLASVPEIDWKKSTFESEVRVALVSTKGAELGTWSLNTDGTWSLEDRYWKMSNE